MGKSVRSKRKKALRTAKRQILAPLVEQAQHVKEKRMVESLRKQRGEMAVEQMDDMEKKSEENHVWTGDDHYRVIDFRSQTPGIKRGHRKTVAVHANPKLDTLVDQRRVQPYRASQFSYYKTPDEAKALSSTIVSGDQHASMPGNDEHFARNAILTSKIQVQEVALAANDQMNIES